MYCTNLDVININEEKNKNFLGIPGICVVGCGIVGNNIMNRLAQLGLAGADTIALSTDKRGLTLVEAEKKILITNAGFEYERHQKAGKMISDADRSILEMTLKDSDMVFVTTGSGDGMCTDAAGVVAEISKKNGAIVVGMISMSINSSRARIQLAEENLEMLRKNSDAIIEIDQNKLLNFASHLPLRQAASIADQIIAETIKGIVETLMQPSLINIDFADLRTIMKSGGNLFMSVGEADLRASPEKIVRNALRNPLVNLDYHGAAACLLHITGGKDLTLKHAAEISSALARELDPEANIIWGARISPTFQQKVRLTTIAKGVRSA